MCNCNIFIKCILLLNTLLNQTSDKEHFTKIPHCHIIATIILRNRKNEDIAFGSITVILKYNGI